MNWILRDTFELACIWMSFVLYFRLAWCHSSHLLRYIRCWVIFFPLQMCVHNNLHSFTVVVLAALYKSANSFHVMISMLGFSNVFAERRTDGNISKRKERNGVQNRESEKTERSEKQHRKWKKKQQRFETGDYINFPSSNFLEIYRLSTSYVFVYFFFLLSHSFSHSRTFSFCFPVFFFCHGCCHIYAFIANTTAKTVSKHHHSLRANPNENSFAWPAVWMWIETELWATHTFVLHSHCMDTLSCSEHFFPSLSHWLPCKHTHAHTFEGDTQKHDRVCFVCVRFLGNEFECDRISRNKMICSFMQFKVIHHTTFALPNCMNLWI